MGNAFGWLKKPIETVVNLAKDFADLILSLLKLGRDAILGSLSLSKMFVEMFLDVFELILKITELLEYISKLIAEYLHIPFIYVYLTPFFLFSLLMINFVEKIISL